MPVSHAAPDLRPRARRRRANRVRILEAATGIVVAEGAEALSIKRVADDADYTPGALYRYYPSKDALLTAVVVHVISSLEEELAERSRAAPDHPLARVFGQIERYCRFSVEQHNAWALLTRMAADPRVLFEELEDASAIMAAIRAALTPLSEAIEAAARAGLLEPGDAGRRTMLVYAGLQGVLQMRKQERLAPGLIDTDRLAIDLVRTLLRGWGAAGPALDAAIAGLDPGPPGDEP